MIAVVLWSAPMAGHDLENTTVLLAFERDGSFVLDVANDPGWLKLRLERFPGSFADRVVLWVDGHEVRPTSVEFLPGPAVATHRLRGRVPPDARTLRWYYGLVIDPYPLAVRRADGRVVVEEIAGDAWSGVIDLSGQFRAPLLDPTIVGLVLAAFLAIPVALRLRSRGVFNTKDTGNTEEIRKQETKSSGAHRGFGGRPAAQAGRSGRIGRRDEPGGSAIGLVSPSDSGLTRRFAAPAE